MPENGVYTLYKTHRALVPSNLGPFLAILRSLICTNQHALNVLQALSEPLDEVTTSSQVQVITTRNRILDFGKSENENRLY